MNENQLTNIVIGYALEIHSQLGPGLLESVYEQCLMHKLTTNGFWVQAQKPIPVFYKDVKLECGFRCDILAEDKLIIEVKSCEALNDLHLAQVLTYLKMANKRVGLLINFNVIKLKDGIREVVNDL
jgi:GxxExxY protein